MTEQELSRRRVLQLGLGAAATAGLVSTAGITHAQAAEAGAINLGCDANQGSTSLQSSVSNAYLFLDQMMDAYAQGSTVRLCQSYSDQIAGRHVPQHSVRLRQCASGSRLSCPGTSQRRHSRHHHR